MNNVKKVSVIIPIYNAEKTIRRCINSIARQTYKNIEIVCIDDGSMDLSNKIVDEMSKDNDRIILISQQNSGAYMARKKGVLKSSGEYIMFVDADDELINKNAISNLVRYFIKYSDIQVVQFGYREHKSRIVAKKVKTNYIIKISYDDMRKRYYSDLVSNSPNGTIIKILCNKIYKSQLLRAAVRNDEVKNRLGEDTVFLLQTLFCGQMKNMLIVPEVYYRYNKYMGNSKDFDYTVFYEYGNTLKTYQNYLCDCYLPAKAKYDCNIETVYFFMAIVRNMLTNHVPKQEVLRVIDECDNYEFLQKAKKYFCTIKDKSLMYKELVFISSNYTPEEYYDYVLLHMPKKSIKRIVVNNAGFILRKVGL